MRILVPLRHRPEGAAEPLGVHDPSMRLDGGHRGVGAGAVIRLDPIRKKAILDIMMPQMDAYQGSAIARSPRFGAHLIVALAARAMKGDREICPEVGASGRLVQPVDTGQLLSAVRLWLHR